MVSALANSAAVNRLLGATSRRGAILAYHGVVPGDEPPSPLHITGPALAAQLDALVELGFRFIPLGEMLARLHEERSVARCVAVTFDDAYRGLDLALPVLQRVQAPATVFVPTDSIGADSGFWWDRLEAIARTCAPNELAELAQSVCGHRVPAGREVQSARAHIMSRGAGRLDAGALRAFTRAEGDADRRGAPSMLCMDPAALARWAQWDGATFAPHTVTHPVLPLLSENEQQREISESYAALRERVDRVIPVIAYPYGLYDRNTLRAARDAGMMAGVTMDRVGCASGEAVRLSIPRLPCGGATPMRRMGLYLSGPWRWYRRRDWRGGFPRVPSPPRAETR